MAKVTIETARKLIKQKYVQSDYLADFADLLTCFGGDSELVGNIEFAKTCSVPDYGDGILRFSDPSPQLVEAGKTNVIRSASILAMSRFFSQFIEPTYKTQHEWTANVRASYFRSCYQGLDNPELSFDEDARHGYIEMDLLGVGPIVHGLAASPTDGYNTATARHISKLQFLYDTNQTTPRKSRWVAFWEYLDIHEAIEVYGSKVRSAVKKNTQYMGGSKSAGSVALEPKEYVRILTFMSTGFGVDSTPTRIVWVGSIESDPIIYEELPYERLPVTFGTGVIAPKLRKPMGRARLQLSTHLGLMEFEREFRNILNYHTIDLVNEAVFNEKAQEAIENGERFIYSTFSDIENKMPHVRIESQPITQELIAYRQQLLEENNRASGLTDMDFGNLPSQNQTAAAINLMAASAKANQSLARESSSRYARDLVMNHEYVAYLGDRSYRVLDVDDVNLPINVPGEPRSDIQHYLEEKAEISVGKDSLTIEEDTLEQLAKAENLKEIWAIGAQHIDPYAFLKVYIKARGFDPADLDLQNAADMAEQHIINAENGGGVGLPAFGLNT